MSDTDANKEFDALIGTAERALADAYRLMVANGFRGSVRVLDRQIQVARDALSLVVELRLGDHALRALDEINARDLKP